MFKYFLEINTSEVVNFHPKKKKLLILIAILEYFYRI